MNWQWTEWLGDIHKVKYVTEHMVGLICIGVAGLCGAIVGLEREKRDKPAGLRTLMLICMGSTIFTQASILLAGTFPDRTRVAAQVVAGIGFLGAGAIIHERRAVSGLTTAATIWAVSAIGLVVGAGFAVAGIVLSFLIFLILTLVRAIEDWIAGPCRYVVVRVQFHSENGKTGHRLRGILDGHHIPASAYRFLQPAAGQPVGAGTGELEIRYCDAHRLHRAFLSEVAVLEEVVEVKETGQ